METAEVWPSSPRSFFRAELHERTAQCMTVPHNSVSRSTLVLYQACLLLLLFILLVPSPRVDQHGCYSNPSVVEGQCGGSGLLLHSRYSMYLEGVMGVAVRIDRMGSSIVDTVHLKKRRSCMVGLHRRDWCLRGTPTEEGEAPVKQKGLPVGGD
ncbi:uncharacterized protein BO80DRAFT_149160 [Aspergillus ibericus CBS 121593]|uniref:Uncharacterized protein n=1 Tax=Aspergillus ibericus CBS 121593 TaxID=1448316 RepID=A0A395GU12_9EURO|nr:hypothetical protein BO80DRAFT_149160 [Aspergillus ibericus CBS 121593]RAK98902.1 hypothetical protein BO80DRAFT_149160 [Aspergillus ibericus CBS 121593]